MSGVLSLQSGTNRLERAVVDVPHTAVATADPTLPTDGDSLADANFLHIYAEFPATVTALGVTPWFFSSIANQWFEGNQLALNATTKIALVQIEREDRVAIVLDSVTGTGQIRIWAGKPCRPWNGPLGAGTRRFRPAPASWRSSSAPSIFLPSKTRRRSFPLTRHST